MIQHAGLRSNDVYWCHVINYLGRCHLIVCYAPKHRLRLTVQHLYGHRGNPGNECADHAAALGTFGLTSNQNVATRWIHHNISTHPRVLMAVKTSLRSWNDCDAFDQMLRRFHQIAISVVFTIGSIVFLVHLTRIFYVIFDLALSLLLAHGFFVLWNKSWIAFPHLSLPCRVLATISHTTRGILCWNCYSTSRLAASSHLLLLKLTWPRSHSLVVFALHLLCYKEGAYDSA